MKEGLEHVPVAPETAAEQAETPASFEAPKLPTEQASESQPSNLRAQTSTLPPAPPKDAVTLSVEKVLEEGMAEAYRTMPAAAKAKFKQEGERVTGLLSEMVRSLKVNASKALSLIRGWLKLIPGVSKYFLIQESKIKTDRLLLLAEEEKKKRGLS